MLNHNSVDGWNKVEYEKEDKINYTYTSNNAGIVTECLSTLLAERKKVKKTNEFFYRNDKTNIKC